MQDSMISQSLKDSDKKQFFVGTQGQNYTRNSQMNDSRALTEVTNHSIQSSIVMAPKQTSESTRSHQVCSQRDGVPPYRPIEYISIYNNLASDAYL